MMWSSTLRLAWRNIWRQPRRTAFTAGAIGLGLAGLLLGLGYVGGMHDYLVGTVTDSLLGDAQIHEATYRQNHDPERVIPDAEPLLAEVEATEGIAAAAPRAYASGLLILSSDELADVVLMGIDPGRERAVIQWSDKFASGGYPERPDEIVIGEELADNLDLSTGQEVHLTVFNFSTRSMDSLKVRITGILFTGNPRIDAKTVVIPIAVVQDRLNIPGAVHEIALRLDDSARTAERSEAVLKRLRRPGIEVASWSELAPLVAKLVDMQQLYFAIAVAIVFLVTAFGIVNALAMSFGERIREFGALMAVGTSAGRLVLLLFLEAACLGLVGAAVGVVIWVAFQVPLAQTGIHLGEMEAAGVKIASRIFPTLDASTVVILCLVYVALTASVAVTTALRVIRLDPVDALRHT